MQNVSPRQWNIFDSRTIRFYIPAHIVHTRGLLVNHPSFNLSHVSGHATSNVHFQYRHIYIVHVCSNTQVGFCGYRSKCVFPTKFFPFFQIDCNTPNEHCISLAKCQSAKWKCAVVMSVSWIAQYKHFRDICTFFSFSIQCKIILHRSNFIVPGQRFRTLLAQKQH